MPTWHASFNEDRWVVILFRKHREGGSLAYLSTCPQYLIRSDQLLSSVRIRITDGTIPISLPRADRLIGLSKSMQNSSPPLSSPLLGNYWAPWLYLLFSVFCSWTPEFAARAQCQVRKLSQVAARGVTTATRFRDRVAAQDA
jgi:hypothetical protein